MPSVNNTTAVELLYKLNICMNVSKTKSLHLEIFILIYLVYYSYIFLGQHNTDLFKDRCKTLKITVYFNINLK